MSLTEEECSICLEKLKKEIAHTSCNHFFHYQCIGNWINRNNYNSVCCPICSQLFEIKNVYLSETVDINPKIKKENEEIISSRKKTISCCIL